MPPAWVIVADEAFECRMSGHGEVHDTPAFMRQDEEHLQELEPNRRHDKELDRHETLNMILEEGPPRL
jgi:hypothetical protein